MTNHSIKGQLKHKYNNLFHVWLITTRDEILIKKFNIHNNKLSLSDLTIEVKTFDGLIKTIEEEWRIFCDIADLLKLTTFASTKDSASNTCYSICLNLGQEEVKLIEDQYDGRFFHYKELLDKINPFQLDADLKESIYFLLGYLDN